MKFGRIITGMSLIVGSAAFGQSITNKADVASEGLTVDSAIIMSEEIYEVDEDGFKDEEIKFETTKFSIGVTGSPTQAVGLYGSLGLILDGKTEIESDAFVDNTSGHNAEGYQITLGLKGKMISTNTFSLFSHVELDRLKRVSKLKGSPEVKENITNNDLSVGITAGTKISNFVTPFLGVSYALLSNGDFEFEGPGGTFNLDIERKNKLSVNPGVNIAIENVDVKAEAILANQQTFMLGAGVRM